MVISFHNISNVRVASFNVRMEATNVIIGALNVIITRLKYYLATTFDTQVLARKGLNTQKGSG